MIDSDPYKIPGTDLFENKLGIRDASTLARKEAEFTSMRLAELRAKPIAGAFSTEHLQRMHQFIYQDLYAFAGELRRTRNQHEIAGPGAPAPEMARTLDRILDALSRENRLQGLSADRWASRSADYLAEIARVQPFLTGNRIAIWAFHNELARVNHLWLRPEKIDGKQLEAALESPRLSTTSNLKRLILMAIDPDPNSRTMNCEPHILKLARTDEHEFSI